MIRQAVEQRETKDAIAQYAHYFTGEFFQSQLARSALYISSFNSTVRALYKVLTPVAGVIVDAFRSLPFQYEMYVADNTNHIAKWLIPLSCAM